MKNKIKEKIEKLLNLSMSDNKHEAALALQKALKLMNEHNITKDEVYKQNFISETMEFDYYRLPDWEIILYSKMSFFSGCVFTWANGYKDINKKAKGIIAGRERDVLNAIYLISFLRREINTRIKKYQNEIKEAYTAKYIKLLSKSFKVGLIDETFQKLLLQQERFFNAQAKGTDLVPIERKTKLKEANSFLEELLGKSKNYKSTSKYDRQGLKDGISNAKDIEINQAVAKQSKILSIKDER